VSESPPPAFEDVLASARGGSPAAVGWLYRHFQPGLLRLLDVIAPDNAEDFASDVWVDVTVALPRFTGDERAFRAWLAHTARSRVIAASRHPERRPAPSETDTEELATYAARVVSVLPTEQADVVLLRVVGGFDIPEVARLLGRQPATVRSLQHRALRRLARQTDSEVRSAS
jgi:RNA polymerase sigma-70 factor (ECF subfamily)